MSQINETMSIAGSGFGAAVIAGAALWLANRTMGKAAFQTAITTGFAELHKQETDARQALHTEITTLRKDMQAERAKANAEMQAERERCDANLDRVAAIVAGLKRLIVANGIELPSDEVLLQGGKHGAS